MVRIIFTASSTCLGRFIRWLSRGQVSHCMIQYPSDLWSGEWCAEATLEGVRKVPAERVVHNVHSSYACLFDVKPALAKIREDVGEPYDFAGLVVFAWVLLIWRYMKVKVRHPWHLPKAMWCSEFIATFLRAAELPDIPWTDDVHVTPEQVRQYCEQHPQHFALEARQE